MMPNMNSGMTQMNAGSCGTKNWRNLFNLVTDGKKVVWRTNAQQHPWLQLDLNQDLYVIKVRRDRLLLFWRMKTYFFR